MEHLCFHPFDEDMQELNVDDNALVTVVCKYQYDGLSKSTNNQCHQENNDDDDEQQEINIDKFLISCVATKQALFDHRIPASEQTNLKKQAHWQEMCNLMRGVLSVEEAKRR
ncbi:uncharacterized protein LOC120358309 [Solenopsis invicta]|nr:uncharacterized protein LOC120358309 [Solenopsis invicta]